MYATDYFVRFVLDHNQAIRDKRRGYSFSSYVLCDTLQEAKDFWQDHVDVNEVEFGRCLHGFGLKLHGLCGFGPFETVQEAETYAQEHHGYAGCDWPCAAIYSGDLTGQADTGDGDLFWAKHLIKVIQY